MDRAAQAGSDDRELSERRVDEAVAQVGVPGEHEAEDGQEEQEEGEDREEPVVGDQRREVAALVVAVFVDDRDRKAQPPVGALVAVDGVDQPVGALRRPAGCAGRPRPLLV